MQNKILDLQKTLFEISELDFDRRWKHWAKEIIAVDQTKTNGYAFDGDFVQSGDVEIDVSKTRVYLVCSETGSNRYRTNAYQVVKMNAGGKFEWVDISTTDETRGWALRIRDDVANLLADINDEKINPLAMFSDDELIAEMNLRGLF